MVRLTDRPDMTLDVYCGCKTTTQQQQQLPKLQYMFLRKYFKFLEDWVIIMEINVKL